MVTGEHISIMYMLKPGRPIYAVAHKNVADYLNCIVLVELNNPGVLMEGEGDRSVARNLFGEV